MEELKHKIIELRQQGKTYKEIALILGCSKGIISFYCSDGKHDCSLEHLKNEIKQYCKNRSIKKAAQFFGCSLSTIKKYKDKQIKKQKKTITINELKHFVISGYVTRLEPNGYLYVYCPMHPRVISKKYIAEHVLIMESHVGRFMEKGELVHHKDGNKQNNNIQNLEIATSKCHVRWHGLCNGLTIDLFCSGCQKTFSRRKNQVKKNQRLYYCNRTCYIKHRANGSSFS